MLRFCDNEVGCVEYSLLNRGELLSYFLSGHLDEVVCVYDDLHGGDFVGIVTYHSLLHALSIDSAIMRDYVSLDFDIWQDAREIFKRKSHDIWKTTLLPVFSKDCELLCFAYQDEDANREIRMIYELQKMQKGVQFADVFSRYKCVVIHGFNELAYFFAEYLRSQKIQVKVEGLMWQDFFIGDDGQSLEHECMHVYAEGTWNKPYNWKENLLRSVSVEFESVDRIYEANIKAGFIGNVRNDVLLESLREEKEIILLGADMRAQDAYDYLLSNGIEVSCFVVDELNVGCMHRLLGKKILGLSEAMSRYKNPVFIDCESKNSAWGLGQTDYYDYIGYKRNDRFIMLQDYVEVPGNNLLNVFGKNEVVLAGDRHLCSRLYEYLTGKNILVAGYLHILPKDTGIENVPEVLVENVGYDTICVIVEPMYTSDENGKVIGRQEKEERIAYFKERNIDNYTDYFSDMVPFIHIEQDNETKYGREFLQPRRIVLGSILSYSGNMFFRSLLDFHPSVLSIYYSDLNSQLFWICVRLSTEGADHVLPLFWKLIENSEKSIINRPAFVEKMEELLACGKSFTSQELFVMIHIAYMYMFRKDVPEDNIRSMIIYWEPHFPERDKLEECVRWLDAKEVSCEIINIVRNSIPAKGAALKYPGYIRGGVKSAYSLIASRQMNIEQKWYGVEKRKVVKFEDLKCRPRETLEEICRKWEIEWSDTLMQTTQNGKKEVYYNYMQNVSGFDLEPVYNTYENFFSEGVSQEMG